MKPIRPSECAEQEGSHIPEIVISVVNSFLKERYRNDGKITIKQDEIIARIQRLNPDLDRREIFDNKWLDFETVYRKNGWEVNYDKPGYCETYDAYFEFTPIKTTTLV